MLCGEPGIPEFDGGRKCDCPGDIGSDLTLLGPWLDELTVNDSAPLFGELQQKAKGK